MARAGWPPTSRGAGTRCGWTSRPEFGGEDTGPMPTELMVAALASCFCLAVVWAAGNARIHARAT